MWEIEPSKVPYEVLFSLKNFGFCACSPRTENQQQQTSNYCSDIAWTQKFGLLKQNLIKDKRIMNIWKEMLSSSMRRHVLCMKPLSCWRRRLYDCWQLYTVLFFFEFIFIFSLDLCGYTIPFRTKFSCPDIVNSKV